MTVMNVDVPDIIARKFVSGKVINLNELTMEEKLNNIDGEGWNDVNVDMEIGDFLKLMKKEVIYNK